VRSEGRPYSVPCSECFLISCCVGFRGVVVFLWCLAVVSEVEARGKRERTNFHRFISASSSKEVFAMSFTVAAAWC
jgi:hypothetical protein